MGIIEIRQAMHEVNKINEMLTNVFRTPIKKFKVTVLSQKCVQYIETLKCNFFYIKLINYFLFKSLSSTLRHLLT